MPVRDLAAAAVTLAPPEAAPLGAPAGPVRSRAPRARRHLHPLAWWGWAVGLAGAAAATTNPVLLALVVGVLAMVVAARRAESPWARAFPLYLGLGAFVVAMRVALHVLVGLKTPGMLVLPLPSVPLPEWAAGITLLGPVTLEGLLEAAVTGARLAVMIVAVGAANCLANPKRLLRALPNALGEIGTAVVIALNVAPQMADAVVRVRRARTLRGDARTGLRAVASVALPVLQDTLDRSLALASSMDARGYGRRAAVAPAERRLTAGLTLAGLLVACVGLYVLLDGLHGTALAVTLIALGLVLAAAGLWLGGRGRVTSTYRPDPWRSAETLTVLAGLAPMAAFGLVDRLTPDALGMPLHPLAPPALPLLALAGLALAALPGLLTPEPPPAASRRPRRGAARTEGRS